MQMTLNLRDKFRFCRNEDQTFKTFDNKIVFGNLSYGIACGVDSIADKSADQRYALLGTMSPDMMTVASVEFSVKEFLSVLQKAKKIVEVDTTFFNHFIFDVYEGGSWSFTGIERTRLYYKAFGNVSSGFLCKGVLNYDKFMLDNLIMFLSEFVNDDCLMTVSAEGVLFRCGKYCFYSRHQTGIMQIDVISSVKGWGFVPKFLLNNLSHVMSQLKFLERVDSERQYLTLYRDKIVIESVGQQVKSKEIAADVVDEKCLCRCTAEELKIRIEEQPGVEVGDLIQQDESWIIAGMKNYEDNEDVIIRFNKKMLEAIFQDIGDNVSFYVYDKRYCLIQRCKELNDDIEWF